MDIRGFNEAVSLAGQNSPVTPRGDHLVKVRLPDGTVFDIGGVEFVATGIDGEFHIVAEGIGVPLIQTMPVIADEESSDPMWYPLSRAGSGQ